jgi:hypothetical protein
MKDTFKIKKWIEKVINSCNTWDQIITCEKLIKNFENQMIRFDYDNMLSLPLLIDLRHKIELKRKDIINNNNFLNN